MCGVIGLVYENHHPKLGRVAAELLKTLEYRGYDSTGAAIQGEGEEVDLRKGVGAPSLMVERLGIVGLSGSVLCGQVRWATFGAVDDRNAQPHDVHCKLHLYGAHNGNVTNCDDLKRWLVSEGHDVRSDNDGEMVVHTVEHMLSLDPEFHAKDPARRRAAFRNAVLKAAAKLEGSYAAVIVDPQTRALWAVKQGSSLYFGVGKDEVGGRFAIASSDLSSVLKLTRVVVPMSEGEAIEMDATAWEAFKVRGEGAGTAIQKQPVRSRLRAKDTTLAAPFTTFMEQEIHAQVATVRSVVELFGGGSEVLRSLRPAIDALPTPRRTALRAGLERLLDQHTDEGIARELESIVWEGEVPPALLSRAADTAPDDLADVLSSGEAGFLADVLPLARTPLARAGVVLFDALLAAEEQDEHEAAVAKLIGWCLEALRKGARIFVVCCGSSQHAAKAAALFTNEIARADLIAVLPGELRGQHLASLRDGDVMIAVSQSGETKDLIDAINEVIATGRDVKRAALVNNVSSTLAQEKCDLVIPLRCGPEIAVPATKSFMNQMAVLYCLALRLAEARLEHGPLDPRLLPAVEKEVARRRASLKELPALISRALEVDVGEAAELLYLSPSMHILATRLTAIAKEGALKIREVVLNHTEGYEGSEFKHGPNTILGHNTIYGPREVAAMLAASGGKTTLSGAMLESLFSDYPLVYVTTPLDRDVALTVSQINTHKIRGSKTIVLAEEHPALRQAASKPPADNPAYRWAYVALPETRDPLLVVFTASVVLQRLALEMSTRKMKWLDGQGVPDHGVHPDVPKNVSKSITVD